MSPRSRPRIPGVSCAILAGGRATRMHGRPKSFLLVDGVPILQRQRDVLAPLFDELFVVANDGRGYGLPVVPDRIPGHGPLSGIHAALVAARADRVFVVACDMPYLTPESVRLVAEAATDAPAVVPVIAGRAEPLFARYHRVLIPRIEEHLARGERKAQSFLAATQFFSITEAELRALDPDLTFLRNLNTPEDLVGSGAQ